MQTIAVTDNLIKLTRYRFVNAFLVREEDGFTLVDTTLGAGAANDLLGAAEQAGGSIRRIALTPGPARRWTARSPGLRQPAADASSRARCRRRGQRRRRLMGVLDRGLAATP